MTTQTTTLVAEWRSFASFLKRPQLPQAASGMTADSFKSVMRLFALDIVLMSMLALGFLIAVAAGFELPAHALNDVSLGVGLILVIVLGAPLFEEVIFRSWLSGRARHVWPGLMLGGAALASGFLPEEQSTTMFVGLSAVAVLVLGALAAGIFLKNAPPYAGFARFFPLIFWLIAAAFALMHVANFDGDASPILLMLVLPQFVLGVLVGYARVQYGLWSAMLLHAMHNGVAVALIVIGRSASVAV